MTDLEKRQTKRIIRNIKQAEAKIFVLLCELQDAEAEADSGPIWGGMCQAVKMACIDLELSYDLLLATKMATDEERKAAAAKAYSAT